MHLKQYNRASFLESHSANHQRQSTNHMRIRNLGHHIIFRLQRHTPPRPHRKRIHGNRQRHPAMYGARQETAFPERGEDGGLVGLDRCVGGVGVVHDDVLVRNDITGLGVGNRDSSASAIDLSLDLDRSRVDDGAEGSKGNK